MECSSPKRAGPKTGLGNKENAHYIIGLGGHGENESIEHGAIGGELANLNNN